MPANQVSLAMMRAIRCIDAVPAPNSLTGDDLDAVPERNVVLDLADPRVWMAVGPGGGRVALSPGFEVVVAGETLPRAQGLHPAATEYSRLHALRREVVVALY